MRRALIQVCVQLPTPDVNVALSAFAAERRAAVYRYRLSAAPSAANIYVIDYAYTSVQRVVYL